jgi:hypothetical protein
MTWLNDFSTFIQIHNGLWGQRQAGLRYCLLQQYFIRQFRLRSTISVETSQSTGGAPRRAEHLGRRACPVQDITPCPRERRPPRVGVGGGGCRNAVRWDAFYLCATILSFHGHSPALLFTATDTATVRLFFHAHTRQPEVTNAIEAAVGRARRSSPLSRTGTVRTGRPRRRAHRAAAAEGGRRLRPAQGAATRGHEGAGRAETGKTQERGSAHKRGGGWNCLRELVEGGEERGSLGGLGGEGGQDFFRNGRLQERRVARVTHATRYC